VSLGGGEKKKLDVSRGPQVGSEGGKQRSRVDGGGGEDDSKLRSLRAGTVIIFGL